MKICVVSHSLIHERQFWFWNWFADFAKAEILQVYPSRWGDLTRPNGYQVLWAGSMLSYELPSEALHDIINFKPDLIYIQQEAYCIVTRQMEAVSKKIGSKLALFVWENIGPYFPPYTWILTQSDLVVCGNSEAESLISKWRKHTLRCIQVGVNTAVFEPIDLGPPLYDIIFTGRMIPEKGVNVLQEAIRGTNWSVLWPERTRTPYNQMPLKYNSAKVLAAPSLDTPLWKEQAPGGYVSLEALACGLYVVTSDSKAMVEGLEGCPGVEFVKQGDATGLRKAIERSLTHKDRNWAGREWIEKHYGYAPVGVNLLDAFRGLGLK